MAPPPPRVIGIIELEGNSLQISFFNELKYQNIENAGVASGPLGLAAVRLLRP